jgi:hypothetical protein
MFDSVLRGQFSASATWEHRLKLVLVVYCHRFAWIAPEKNLLWDFNAEYTEEVEKNPRENGCPEKRIRVLNRKRPLREQAKFCHLRYRRASLPGYGVGMGARVICGGVRFALGVVAPWSSREFQPELAM